MAYYLVKAKPSQLKLSELAKRLESGEVRQMKPFGRALEYSLKNARENGDGFWTWEEEDYCIPPLATERAALLDSYFTHLSTDKVEKDTGWKRIEHLSRVWDMSIQ